MKSRTISRAQSLKQPQTNNQLQTNEIKPQHSTISAYLHSPPPPSHPHPHLYKNNQIIHDAVSVIEEVRDSFASGDDLLKQFQQYGIQIQNVQVDGDMEEEERNICEVNSRCYNQFLSQRRNYQFQSVLDYSNMAKLKEKELHRADSKLSKIEYWKKLKPVAQQLFNLKEQFIKSRDEMLSFTKKVIREMERNIQIIISQTTKNNKQLESKYKKQIQGLKILKQDHKRTLIQLQQLKEVNKTLNQQKYAKNIGINSVVMTNNSNQTNGLEVLQQNRKKGLEMQIQYQKQSKMLKCLNQQIRQLSQQLENTRIENKRLKSQTRQNEKITNTNTTATATTNSPSHHQSSSQQTQKQIQTYNRFLQKIQQLEDEINQMKRKQKEQKKYKIEEWKMEIKDQLEQIQEFLCSCQNKQKELDQREKQLNDRQLAIRRQEENKRRMNTTERHTSNQKLKDNRQEQNNSPWQRSPTSPNRLPNYTKHSKPRLSTQPSLYNNSEKLIKYSSEMYSSSSKKIIQSARLEYHEKNNINNINSYNGINRQHLKFSGSAHNFHSNVNFNVNFNHELNSRLSRIQSCIQSQLNALAQGH